MSSTATTIAITNAQTTAMTAAMNAAIAQQRADACRAAVRGFTHDAATIEQRQAYAECVERLYPTSHPIDGGTLAVLKFAVFCLLLCVAVFAYRGWREERDIVDATLGALFGLVAGMASIICLGVLFGALAFLFY